jgi:hypothetical protein
MQHASQTWCWEATPVSVSAFIINLRSCVTRMKSILFYERAGAGTVISQSTAHYSALRQISYANNVANKDPYIIEQGGL